jgi:hypothetical protein
MERKSQVAYPKVFPKVFWIHQPLLQAPQIDKGDIIVLPSLPRRKLLPLVSLAASPVRPLDVVWLKLFDEYPYCVIPRDTLRQLASEIRHLETRSQSEATNFGLSLEDWNWNVFLSIPMIQTLLRSSVSWWKIKINDQGVARLEEDRSFGHFRTRLPLYVVEVLHCVSGPCNAECLALEDNGTVVIHWRGKPQFRDAVVQAGREWMAMQEKRIAACGIRKELTARSQACYPSRARLLSYLPSEDQSGEKMSEKTVSSLFQHMDASLLCSEFVIIVWQVTLFLADPFLARNAMPMNAASCTPQDILRLPLESPRFWTSYPLPTTSSRGRSSSESRKHSEIPLVSLVQ